MRRTAFDMVWCAFAMPPSRLCCRCLVFLLLVAGAGFLAPPAEAATRPFADIVDAAARRHGVDADLVHAVIAVESGYRATAQSPAGAQGLMQLMPGTQRDLGVADAFDPRQNVDAGVAYLRRLTNEFGTVLALAAYNAGPGAVRRYNGIPPYEQTHAYVRAVLDRGRPAADVQEPEERDPSGDRAHAGSEADLAEDALAEPRLQDDHQAADGAAGLGPRALDKAELDPAADTVRLVLHRSANRLMVDVEPGHDTERPVIATMQAPDPGAQRGHKSPSPLHRWTPGSHAGIQPTRTGRFTTDLHYPRRGSATARTGGDLRFRRRAARPAWRELGEGSSRDEQHGGARSRRDDRPRRGKRYDGDVFINPAHVALVEPSSAGDDHVTAGCATPSRTRSRPVRSRCVRSRRA